MMNLQGYIKYDQLQEYKTSIGNGQVEKPLDNLSQLFNEHPDLYKGQLKDLVFIQFKLSRFKADKEKGLKSYSELEVIENNIANSILNLIDGLEKFLVGDLLNKQKILIEKQRELENSIGSNQLGNQPSVQEQIDRINDQLNTVTNYLVSFTAKNQDIITTTKPADHSLLDLDNLDQESAPLVFKRLISVLRNRGADQGDYTEKLNLLSESLIEFIHKNKSEIISNNRKFKATFLKDQLFSKIVFVNKLSKQDILDINEIRNDHTKYDRYDRELITAALSLGVMKRYNSEKVSILIDIINDGEESVWERALIGLVLGIKGNELTLRFNSKLMNRLKMLENNPLVQSGIGKAVMIINTARIVQDIIEGGAAGTELFKMQIQEITKDIEEEHPKILEFFSTVAHWFYPLGNNSELIQKLEIPYEFTQMISNSSILPASIQYLLCFSFQIAPNDDAEHLEEIISFLENEDQLIAEIKNQVRLDLDAIFIKCIGEYLLFYNFFPREKPENIFTKRRSLAKSALIKTIASQSELRKIRINHHVLEALKLSSLGQFSLVEKHIKQLKALAPLDAWSLSQIGTCYQEQENYEKALEYHLKSAELESDNVWNLGQIGWCYQKENNYEKALEYHLKSEELEPKNEWSLRQVGWCYQQQNDYEKALEYYLKSEELEPDNAWNLGQIGWDYQQKRNYEKALVYHLRSEELEPDNAWNLRQVGWCYQKQNIYEKALEYYLKSEALEPDDAWDLRQIGWCYQKQSNYKKALVYHLRSEELEPDNPWSLSEISWCHHVMEKRELRDSYITLIENLSTNEKYGVLGWRYFTLGDLDNAKLNLEKTIELKIFDDGDLINLGHLYLCFEEEEKAMTYYQKRLQTDTWTNFLRDMEGDYTDLSLEQFLSRAYYDEIIETLKKNKTPDGEN